VRERGGDKKENKQHALNCNAGCVCSHTAAVSLSLLLFTWHSAQYRLTKATLCRNHCFPILYIKMNVCLYLIQIHISEPIGTKLCTHLPRGLEETVGYVWAHNISPFPPFRPILSGAHADSCTVDGCRRHTNLLLPYIRGAAHAGVTSQTAVGCAMKTPKSEWNACVCKNGTLMRREGSD
jgi:hypothetical protein